MNKKEILCAGCEAESYIESDGDIHFCPHCGCDVLDEEVDWDEEDLEELEEDN